MPTHGDNGIDVFEADAESHRGAEGGRTDHVVVGTDREPRTHRVQAYWKALPSVDRRVTVICAAALIVAVVAGVSAVRAHPGEHRSVRTTVIAAATVSVDAFGCPRGRQCLTQLRPATLLAAAREALPGGQVMYAVQEVDAHSGAVYRVALSLAADQTSVQVNSQCLPGAAPVIGQPIAVTRLSGTTLAPLSTDEPTPPGLKVWSITLPSPRSSKSSCGIDVRAESALELGIDGRAIDTVVNLLADDPRLMASA